MSEKNQLNQSKGRGGKRPGAGRKEGSVNFRRLLRSNAQEFFTSSTIIEAFHGLTPKERINLLQKLGDVELDMEKLEIYREQVKADIKLKEKQMDDGITLRADPQTLDDVFTRMARLDKETSERLQKIHERDQSDDSDD